MEDEKQLKNSFCLVREKTSSNRGFTAHSLGVYPARSTLVESCSRASTPRLPYSAKGCRSKGLPSGGERSILKSPVWITTPTGVSMAKATQSTSECVTRIGSMLKGPIVNLSLG